MEAVPLPYVHAFGLSRGVRLTDKGAQLVAAAVTEQLREVSSRAHQIALHCRRSVTTTDDVAWALKSLGHAPILGFRSARIATNYNRLDRVNEPPLFVSIREKTKLEDVLKQPLPKVPRGPSLTAHWLAIEGIQPSVAENPSANKRRKIERPDISSTEDGIVIKPIGSHILTEELQLYFKKLVGHLRGDVRELQLAVLRSVASDGGISPLLPYITNFIAEEVAANLTNLPRLQVCMALVYALLRNSVFQLELYLHTLLPVILTCVVSRRLCLFPYSEDHWSLRRYAASLLAAICSKYGERYPDIPLRVTKALHEALMNPAKPLTTHYGAIIGLWYQGPKVTESCLIPFAQGYALNLQRISNLEVHPSAKAPEAIQPQAEQKREKEAESKEAKDKAKKQAKKQLVAMYDPGKRHDAMRTLELLMLCVGLHVRQSLPSPSHIAAYSQLRRGNIVVPQRKKKIPRAFSAAELERSKPRAMHNLWKRIVVEDNREGPLTQEERMWCGVGSTLRRPTRMANAAAVKALEAAKEKEENKEIEIVAGQGQLPWTADGAGAYPVIGYVKDAAAPGPQAKQGSKDKAVSAAAANIAQRIRCRSRRVVLRPPSIPTALSKTSTSLDPIEAVHTTLAEKLPFVDAQLLDSFSGIFGEGILPYVISKSHPSPATSMFI